MTSKELNALKNNALSNHPWKITTAAKLLSKVRRDLGETHWETLLRVQAEAKESNDASLWASAINPLIEKSKEEEEKALLEEKNKMYQEIEKKRQELLAARRISDTISRIAPNSVSNTVVRRRRPTD